MPAARRCTIGISSSGWGTAFGVLFFTLLLGVLSGAYPAFRMSRLNPVDALKGGV